MSMKFCKLAVELLIGGYDGIKKIVLGKNTQKKNLTQMVSQAWKFLIS